MTFRFQHLRIPEVVLVVPTVHQDDRGFFEETYKKSDFVEAGLSREFVQDNHSFSVKGTLRGLHFQNPPYAQGKLVRCVQGRILDVVVDIRIGSPTFSEWVSHELSSESHEMLWIPEGFAHGFLALEDSHVEYKVTNEYSRDSESGISWNDKVISIEWPISDPIVSGKDGAWGKLDLSECKFVYKGRE